MQLKLILNYFFIIAHFHSMLSGISSEKKDKILRSYSAGENTLTLSHIFINLDLVNEQLGKLKG